MTSHRTGVTSRIITYLIRGHAADAVEISGNSRNQASKSYRQTTACGVAAIGRHSAAKSCVSKLLSLPTVTDVLAGRQQEIHAERDRKLEAARQQRQSRRQQAV